MILKRVFDIVVSFLGLLLLWPLIVVLAIVVRLTSPGPAFYTQKRVGKGGKRFNCYKFRTMVRNADKQGSVTVGTDIRITSIGKILRKYKLDELPQLWNVMIGKMSFVGPRPDVPGYADALKGEETSILKLRPGITGPATLYFRNEEVLLTMTDNPIQFNDTVLWPFKVKINMKYLREWSFITDIEYVLITIFPFLNSIFKLVDPSPRNPEKCIEALKQII
jgi:lipopolysaccharide/colanic/teichoic acid biosynthesis glycosyltransferase